MASISSDASFTLIVVGLVFVFIAVVMGLCFFVFLRFTARRSVPKHYGPNDVEQIHSETSPKFQYHDKVQKSLPQLPRDSHIGPALSPLRTRPAVQQQTRLGPNSNPCARHVQNVTSTGRVGQRFMPFAVPQTSEESESAQREVDEQAVVDDAQAVNLVTSPKHVATFMPPPRIADHPIYNPQKFEIRRPPPVPGTAIVEGSGSRPPTHRRAHADAETVSPSRTPPLEHI